MSTTHYTPLPRYLGASVLPLCSPPFHYVGFFIMTICLSCCSSFFPLCSLSLSTSFCRSAVVNFVVVAIDEERDLVLYLHVALIVYDLHALFVIAATKWENRDSVRAQVGSETGGFVGLRKRELKQNKNKQVRYESLLSIAINFHLNVMRFGRGARDTGE